MKHKGKNITILGIETSCDETSAAVLRNGKILANLVSSQEIHKDYGGVVPELASRAHQKNIVPIVDKAICEAKVSKSEIDAVAYTYGPGLIGALMVGTSFAKGFAASMQLPLLPVHHMKAHVLAHFIKKDGYQQPHTPFLCLTVSGGHTQIVRVNENLEMEILGETIDDAAGEAFDKTAKLLGLSYPGGALIDKYAKEGDSNRFDFPIAKTQGFDFSFSGLKTAILYFIRENTQKDDRFIEKNINDICASVQNTIIKTLLIKFKQAIKEQGIETIALAGGVSANSELRERVKDLGNEMNCNVHIPPFEYCTDNAAMIAMAGYLNYIDNKYDRIGKSPDARAVFSE